MSSTINYLEEKEIVQVNIEGRVNFKIAQQYSIDAIEIAREHNCKHFLLDHTKTILGEENFRIYTDGNSLEHFGFKRHDKIAIVISNDINDSQYLEKADPNVRWSSFKYFNSKAHAYAWLAGNE